MEEPTMASVPDPSNVLHSRHRQPGGLTLAEPQAESAEALRSRHFRVLTSRPLRDIRREPRGGFAGPVGPDRLVGTFADRPRRRSQATGSFATGSLTGEPDRQREGSFADAERIVIVTHDEAGERSRVSGRAGVRRLLRSSALDDDAVDLALAELQIGHAVVFHDGVGITQGERGARLEQTARAA
jgi:hypothetical protein